MYNEATRSCVKALDLRNELVDKLRLGVVELERSGANPLKAVVGEESVHGLHLVS